VQQYHNYDRIARRQFKPLMDVRVVFGHAGLHLLSAI